MQRLLGPNGVVFGTIPIGVADGRAYAITVLWRNERILRLCDPLWFGLGSFFGDFAVRLDGDYLPTPVRVLVVDDYEPFRRFVVSMLKQTELQVICRDSDGLEAVEKAAELQPDLVLLDIGLPKLNGIEAARRIRELSPKSKIIFVSQESSVDIVQEALSLGAQGFTW